MKVSYKAGYVNPVAPPAGFSSARLWGIAIADTRVPGHESAQVEVGWTRLSCRIDGREVVLNDDAAQVQGGLYRRQPWFGTDAHDPMPVAYDPARHAVVFAWASVRIGCGISGARRHAPLCRRASSKAVRCGPGSGFPPARCCRWAWTTGVRRLSRYGSGGNNHEAGASDWYFPSPRVAGSLRSPTWEGRGSSRTSGGRAPCPAGRAGRPSSTAWSLLE